MTRKILKYAISTSGGRPTTTRQVLPLPSGSKVLTVMAQGGFLSLVVSVPQDTNVRFDQRVFYILETGASIPPDVTYPENVMYLGTVQQETARDGVLVLHVFESK